MKFIVPAQKEETQEKYCGKYTTMCWLCSEDPRACGSDM